MNRSILERTCVAVLVAGAPACKSDPGPAQASVFVEKLTDAGCYAACPGSGSPAAGLVFPNTCGVGDAGSAPAGPFSCGFLGGIDTMRVTVDYGIVDIDSVSGITAPTLQALGNQTTLFTQTLSLGPLGQGQQRLYATGTHLAPPTPAMPLVLQASVGGGDVAQPAGSYDIGVTGAAVTVTGCGDAGTCTLQTGTVSVLVSVSAALQPAGAAPITALLTPYVDEQPGTTGGPIMLNASGGQLVGSQSFNVPAVGTTWQFFGTAGGLPIQSAPLSLIAPTITASIQGCDGGAACVTAGTNASLFIQAPYLTQPTMALVVESVDGVQVGTTTPTLAPCAAADDAGPSDCVVASVPVADAPGHTWGAAVSVGLYSASPPISTMIAAPDAGAPADASAE